MRYYGEEMGSEYKGSSYSEEISLLEEATVGNSKDELGW